MQRLYEVRVREQVGPDKWVKKSKFYWSKNPGDAAKKYKGKGLVMWSEKTSKEKLLGIGGFFDLGDQLLEEYSQDENKSLVEQITENKGKKQRGYYGKQKGTFTHRS